MNFWPFSNTEMDNSIETDVSAEVETLERKAIDNMRYLQERMHRATLRVVARPAANSRYGLARTNMM